MFAAVKRNRMQEGDQAMVWPKEQHPSGTRYAIIEAFHKLRFEWVVLILLGGYVGLQIVFGLLYYVSPSFENHSLRGCVYYAFVTGTTIGFGDGVPTEAMGKTAVVIQGLLSTLYFAMMVAFLGVKMLFPNHTLHFSDRILFDGEQYIFRIINSHRGLLVNPDVRISVVAHCSGNVIAPTYPIKKIDTLHWLDNHDFCIGFPDEAKGIVISDELKKAREHKAKSRFKIRITVSGSYGMQQYVQVINYNEDDVIDAVGFKAIAYCDEDRRIWRNIRFGKFGDFWKDFNTTENVT